MIQKFVDIFMENKPKLEKMFKENEPKEYLDIVKAVVSILSDEDYYSTDEPIPDPERIHVLDDGDYQGTLVFNIGATGYQPSQYWYVHISYGSCSCTDTIEAINDFFWEDIGLQKEQQIKDYGTLALHVVQKLKRMDSEKVYIERLIQRNTQYANQDVLFQGEVFRWNNE